MIILIINTSFKSKNIDQKVNLISKSRKTEDYLWENQIYSLIQAKVHGLFLQKEFNIKILLNHW
jgi:hypothetical protein